VGVEVHDAGRQDEAARVHPLARGPEIAAAAVTAERGDAAVRDRQAAVARGRAETIDEAGVVDDEIVHGEASWGLACLTARG